MATDTNIFFQVSLNNGETFTENSEKFSHLNTSSWLQLQDYLNENNFKITSLGLVSKNNVHYNLPSLKGNPKFASYNHTPPISYNFFRRVSREVGNNSVDDLFTTIRAEYEKHFIEIWVSENEDSWINYITKN